MAPSPHDPAGPGPDRTGTPGPEHPGGPARPDGSPRSDRRGPVVHKYGGSSLATIEQVRAVAQRVAATHRTGRPVVVVVSARGKTTDRLLRLAEAVGAPPAGRETDQLLATGENASAALLAMALHRTGVRAVSLVGAQTGILATGTHGRGVIVTVDTDGIDEVLARGAVAVVAGFQGLTARREVITLGRGGSDTTAVALAAELGAAHCEIYTDVDGVFTADPRLLPGARVLPAVDVDVMAEMAFAGARVMHARAVELAALRQVDIHVKHSARPGPGTVIAAREETKADMLESPTTVTGVVLDADVARVTLRFDAGDADAATDVFAFLARESLTVDMAALSDESTGVNIGITLHTDDVEPLRDYLERRPGPPGRPMESDEGITKLSLVGTGLLSRPDSTARMLRCLKSAAIAPSSVSTSQMRISVTVPDGDAVRAARVLHDEFGLTALTAGTGVTASVPA
ncbi:MULTISPECIES: aspartate kinase [unclassified Streptomyces]|uniref:aspartate kinase n=1 Tax=unclassified Streptomyces TaxID=2593676 RepID=UPI0033F81CFF